MTRPGGHGGAGWSFAPERAQASGAEPRKDGRRLNRTLTVLAVMDSREVSGPAKQLLATVERAAEVDVQYRLAVFRRGPHDTPLVVAARRLGIDPIVLTSRYRGDPLEVLGLLRLVRSPGIDIVQTHGYKPNVLMALIRGGRSRSWISFLHGETAENRLVKLYFWLERAAVRFADRAVVVSEAQRQLYRRVSSAKLRVVHNAAILHERVPREPTERPLVGVVGRLSPEKGVDVALRAFARIRRDAQLAIVGDGPERPRLVRLAASLGIADRVSWEGWVDDIARVYRRLWVLVISSRSEGMPNVALEAMAVGVPVVATRVGGLPELLEDRRTGLLVPSSDPEALASAVERVLDNAGERDRFAAAAKQTVDERFSIRHRLERLRAIYEEVATS